MNKPFSAAIQQQALRRQGGTCASCATPIGGIGNSASDSHKYGEGAQGHHMIPQAPPLNGPHEVENCVVLCRSCHISAHQGGRWRDTSIYSDILGLPMAAKIKKIAKLYPHYNGR